MKRLRKINRSWDAGLTITTIVLTLAITIMKVKSAIAIFHFFKLQTRRA